jgi:hypothetical protein
MGATESKKEIVTEAYSYTLAEALNSLEALLLIKHQALFKTDSGGYYYVLGTNGDKFFVHHQLLETQEIKVYRAYIRVTQSKDSVP